ncbi:hypothetical protein CF327_g6298 [Tilletia walkeri]|nr:hypothetical protein CF327_g6298 [Tilletia walkeri]
MATPSQCAKKTFSHPTHRVKVRSVKTRNPTRTTQPALQAVFSVLARIGRQSSVGEDRRLKKQHDSDEKTRTVTGGEAHAHTLSAGAIIRRTVTTSVSAVLTKSTVDIIAFAFAQVPAPVRKDKNPAKSFASNVKTRNTKETLSQWIKAPSQFGKRGR